MAKRQPRTVLEVSVAKLGVHRGALAAAQVAQWALATCELGHVPTTVEYSEFWCVTERTGWLHRAHVRDVFGDEWPAVVQSLSEHIEKKSPRAVTKLAVPALA
jgi:hypothetical protein